VPESSAPPREYINGCHAGRCGSITGQGRGASAGMPGGGSAVAARCATSTGQHISHAPPSVSNRPHRFGIAPPGRGPLIASVA
jgi:hypothetical protein